MTVFVRVSRACGGLLALLALGCGGDPIVENDEGTSSEELVLSVRSEATVLSDGGEPADLHYPEVPSALRPIYRDRYPIVVMLQGARVPREQYHDLARGIASRGFVVVVPDHSVSLVPGRPPALFTDQRVFVDALAEMELRDADPDSPLFEIIDVETSAVIGHSFGGVVGLYNIDGACNPPICFGGYERPSSLKAGIFYGTNTFLNGFLLDVDTADVPVALIAGSDDGVSTPEEVRATFDDAIDPHKLLITVEGANHFGLTQENPVPGAEPDPNGQTLGQDDSIRRIARWSGRTLRALLFDDPVARYWLYQAGGSADGTVTVEAVFPE